MRRIFIHRNTLITALALFLLSLLKVWTIHGDIHSQFHNMTGSLDGPVLPLSVSLFDYIASFFGAKQFKELGLEFLRPDTFIGELFLLCFFTLLIYGTGYTIVKYTRGMKHREMLQYGSIKKWYHRQLIVCFFTTFFLLVWCFISFFLSVALCDGHSLINEISTFLGARPVSGYLLAYILYFFDLLLFLLLINQEMLLLNFIAGEVTCMVSAIGTLLVFLIIDLSTPWFPVLTFDVDTHFLTNGILLILLSIVLYIINIHWMKKVNVP